MKKTLKTGGQDRRDRLLHEHNHDPCQEDAKRPGPAACPECQASHHRGQWRREQPQPGARAELRPACQRIRDHYPAGEVWVVDGGDSAKRAELVALIRHQDVGEKARHPLNRIMRIEQRTDPLLVQTTDSHLPHRLGEALLHAHKGRLETHYDEAGCFATVRWAANLTSGGT